MANERGSSARSERVGTWAALLGILVMLLMAALSSRWDAASAAQVGAVSGELGLGTAAGGGRAVPEQGEWVIAGLALRELPSEGEAPSAPSAESLADPQIGAMFEGLPGWKLEPPGQAGCRARVWLEGELIGEPASCDAQGAYELRVPAPEAGVELSVELEIPGQLRGIIPLSIPARAELGGERSGGVPAPTVALGPGHRVAGQVVDARGEALAGVAIQALPRPVLEGTLPWRTLSDEEGRFEFTTLPYGPVSLRGIRPGYALSVVEAVAPEDRVLLVLDALIDLEGEVFADAEQLARGVVRLEGSAVWPAIELPLAGEGPFVFERLPDGVYAVEVQVPPAAPGGQEYASVPLENVTPDLRVSLAVVPAFRVPVRVVDPDGEPIRGARVTLGYSQIGMLQKVAETGSDGRARVGPVVPGPYLVHADADGFLPPEPVEVEVTADGFVADEQVLVLIRPAKLEGIVVDENEQPVAGAEVMLDSEVDFSVGEGASRRQLFAVALGADSGSLGVTRGEVPDIPLFADDPNEGSAGMVITDAEGRFEIDLLLPGTHRLWATHGEHAASAVESFELRSGELRAGLRLQLREGVPLTGVVRSGNGEPIEGAQVDLGDGLVLRTDERGVFDAGFRRGPQIVVVRAVGMTPTAVELDLRDEGRDLEVNLEPALARVEGRVVDGNGQPVADVEVELQVSDGLSPSLITWTDARGVYEFEALPPGEVSLSFRHGDYLERDGAAAAAVSPGPLGEIELTTGWRISVLVRSTLRGDPIGGVMLRAGERSASTDKHGRATLSQLVGARVSVEAEAAGWVGKRVEVNRGEEGGEAGGEVSLTIELIDGGSLEGVIDDDIGEPVSGALIEVFDSSGERVAQTKSKGRGRWRIDGVSEGEVLIRVSPPTSLSAVLAPVEVESDVIRGEVTSALHLRLERQ